jgi:hypothetical protein
MAKFQRATSLDVPALSGDESSGTNTAASHHDHDHPSPKAELSPGLAWSQKNLLSLGKLVRVPCLVICLTRNRWRRNPWLLDTLGSPTAHGVYC